MFVKHFTFDNLIPDGDDDEDDERNDYTTWLQTKSVYSWQVISLPWIYVSLAFANWMPLGKNRIA